MATETRWDDDIEVLVEWLEEEIDKCDDDEEYKPSWSLILNSLQVILSELERVKEGVEKEGLNASL